MRYPMCLLFAGLMIVTACPDEASSRSRTATAGQTRLLPLTVVPVVDPYRYMGTWFEIARLPNHTQRLCASDVTSTFEPRPDGRIDVTNRCRQKNGDVFEVTGVARPVNGHPSSSLQIRYGASLFSFLPAVWDDYQIMELGDGYEFAVVGTPDRKHLWVLSRQPVMSDEQLRELAERARAQAFDVDELIRTRHTTS